MPRKRVILKKICSECGKEFSNERKNGGVHGPKQFSKRMFCSNRCKGLNRGITKEQHARMIAARTYPTGKDNKFYIHGKCSIPGYLNWTKNRRNRLKRATIEKLGTHTYEEWQELKKEYNYTCPCCGKSEPEITLTEDHIIPLSKDGTDLIINIQPLCLACNVRKHTEVVRYQSESMFRMRQE